MKTFAIIFIAILMLSFSQATLDVKKTDISPTVIAELNDPALFNFEITNNGDGDYFEIYTLIGVTMTPKGTFYLNSGEKQTIEVGAYPSKEVRSTFKGPFTFEYQIKGTGPEIFKDKLKIKIISLKDILYIEPIKLAERDKISLTIKNQENIKLDDITLDFSSKFFDGTKTLSLEPFGKETLEFDITKDINNLVAGEYPLKVEVAYQGKKASFESSINYLEKGGLSVSRESSGLIVKTTKIVKTNEGNLPLEAEIKESKNALTRLFTTFSENPTSSVRKGLSIEYQWQKDLSPGEVLTVEFTTNYTIPFFLLILIVVVTLGVKIYSQTNLSINKRVSLVKTKGGELALKVTLRVKAKKHLDNIEIIDRLPMMTKIYEKFGTKPDRMEEKTRRLFWNLKNLNAGEERAFTYIIYSKINIVGRFELPEALALYECEGKPFRTTSNKTYFASETVSTNL